MGQGVLLYYKKKFSIIQVDNNDLIKIFKINKLGIFGRGI